MFRILSYGSGVRSNVFSFLPLVILIVLVLPHDSAATTRYVANNGVDSNVCGSASPCRSITQAITNAAPGDTIMVGPGSYGDLNLDGTLGNSPGEENPQGCTCLLAVTKSVTLISSDGAASTIIDARTVANLSANVYISANGVHFGASGQGFTITNTLTPATSETASYGLIAAADLVSVQGNRVVALVSNGQTFTGIGGGISLDDTSRIVIQGNQVSGWVQGIAGEGVNIAVSQNTAQANYVGIAVDAGAAATGNVVTGNTFGIKLFGRGATANGNAALGNQNGFDASAGGTLEGNNIFGNGCGVFMQASPPLAVLADNNYWGAASGPGSDPADGLCGSSATAATVNPFATKPFKVKPKVTP